MEIKQTIFVFTKQFYLMLFHFKWYACELHNTVKLFFFICRLFYSIDIHCVVIFNCFVNIKYKNKLYPMTNTYQLWSVYPQLREVKPNCFLPGQQNNWFWICVTARVRFQGAQKTGNLTESSESRIISFWEVKSNSTSGHWVFWQR